MFKQIGILCALASLLSACGASNDVTPSNSADQPSTTVETQSASAPATDDGWSVGQQLIHGKPWGSEQQPLEELQTNVKEAEKTPDNRLRLALKDLAGWHRGKGHYDEAEKIYRRIADLEGALYGKQPGTVASNDLAVVYTEKGDYPKAETEFKKLMDNWKGAENQGRNQDLAEQKHNYAVLLEKLGRKAEADEMEASAKKLKS